LFGKIFVDCDEEIVGVAQLDPTLPPGECFWSFKGPLASEFLDPKINGPSSQLYINLVILKRLHERGTVALVPRCHFIDLYASSGFSLSEPEYASSALILRPFLDYIKTEDCGVKRMRGLKLLAANDDLE